MPLLLWDFFMWKISVWIQILSSPAFSMNCWYDSSMKVTSKLPHFSLWSTFSSSNQCGSSFACHGTWGCYVGHSSFIECWGFLPIHHLQIHVHTLLQNTSSLIYSIFLLFLSLVLWSFTYFFLVFRFSRTLTNFLLYLKRLMQHTINKS